MKYLPLDLGTIHFVGIGGIGMSGIAEVMYNLGYSVQGSDILDNSNVRRLKSLGIDIVIGHNRDNIDDASVLVVSSAVEEDNPEILAARTAQLPVVRRAEMLAELMRLKWSIAVGGTHGKTTTTSMIAALLDSAGMDPTVINGGIINAYGTNARLGSGDWMVVEADESDGSFLRLPALISIVTNIDAEHLDHYGDFDALREAFQTFVENIPFYGLAVVCSDHKEVRRMVGRISDRRIVTFGLDAHADVRAQEVTPTLNGVGFSVSLSGRSSGAGRRIEGIELNMPGTHNVRNALAVITVAIELGIQDGTVKRAMSEFKGVKRRFTTVGVAGGVTVVDDYGHHPVEIAAVLGAARERCNGRIVAVVQPHRFSRLKSLFKDFCACFGEADAVVVADVYPAGEKPIVGADRDSLVFGLRSSGSRNVYALADPQHLAQLIVQLTKPGDMVVCLGAGTITQWAHALPEELSRLAVVADVTGDAR